jgi:hypothetical protein
MGACRRSDRRDRERVIQRQLLYPSKEPRIAPASALDEIDVRKNTDDT